MCLFSFWYLWHSPSFDAKYCQAVQVVPEGWVNIDKLNIMEGPHVDRLWNMAMIGNKKIVLTNFLRSAIIIRFVNKKSSCTVIHGFLQSPDPRSRGVRHRDDHVCYLKAKQVWFSQNLKGIKLYLTPYKREVRGNMFVGHTFLSPSIQADIYPTLLGPS